MILTWVLTPILNLITSIIGTLPSADLSWLPAYSTAAASFTYGEAWTSSFIPWTGLGVLVLIGGSILVAVIVFELAQWAYRELPDLWGFGPS